MRAALYARYSTDNQSTASVEDQLVKCRQLAERLGAHVVREFSDDAVSGAAIANRPGVRQLLELARTGGCDVVIAEHTNRLARKGGRGWDIFDDFRAWGVKYVTVLEGEVTTTHQGVSALVSELKLEETSKQTRRGQEGVIRAGRAVDSIAYGYEAEIRHDARGDRIPGLRRICEPEAEIVRRIFAEYAAGRSPRAIAEGLNADGVPGPRGGPWNRTTIAGNPARGLGVLHNELYRGVRLWGRLTLVKDRHTGKRRARPGTGDVLRVEVPELRIVPESLWNQVQAQLARHAVGPAGEGRGQRRPTALLSGLIRCGVCGAKMNRCGARDTLRCAARIERGASACANGRTPRYADVERRVLTAVRDNLLHPEVLARAAAAAQAEFAEAERARRQSRAGLERELAEVTRKAGRLVDQVAEGVLEGATVRDKLRQLEARRAELARQVAEAGGGREPKVVTLPSVAVRLYRELVEQLHHALGDDGDTPADAEREAIRELVEEVRLMPGEARGAYALQIVGQLEPLLCDTSAPEAMRVTKSRSCFDRSHSFEARLTIAG